MNTFDRYQRQTLLPEIGLAGQKKLHESFVLIIGCGGLGSIVAPYLAGAGVGRIRLVDGDNPSLSNLHRQVFFTESDKESKSITLSKHLRKLNSEIRVETLSQMLSKSNVEDAFHDVDLVIECSDSMPCKYLVNDYSHFRGIPMVYGAIHKYEGYVSLFKNESSEDCHLRDVFPEINRNIQSCSEVGVLNTIAGIIGLFQANEALKHILGIGKSLEGELLSYNALENSQFKFKLQKNWRKPIKQTLDTLDYSDLGCETISEISWINYLKNSDDYQLISILDSVEEPVLIDGAQRIAMRDLKPNHIQDFNKPVALYCMSGKRSAVMVTELLNLDSALKVFSIKGGRHSFKDAH